VSEKTTTTKIETERKNILKCVSNKVVIRYTVTVAVEIEVAVEVEVEYLCVKKSVAQH